MLRVALTGGIGAGKSTVAANLVRCGARVVDADIVAREVVAPGTPGLAAVVQAFGPQMLTGDGGLDRAALGQLVFADPLARRRLEEITHPLIAERSDRLVADAGRHGDGPAVVVHDVPLLVEQEMAPRYHLVVIVDAPEEVRLRRLVVDRGMAEDQARARIASQADVTARRIVADVWVDNAGAPESTAVAVRRVWAQRLWPYAENLAAGRAAAAVDPGDDTDPGSGPGWPAAALRVRRRLAAALDLPVQRIRELGALRLAVELPDGAGAAQAAGTALDAAGFAPVGPALRRSADPALPVTLETQG